MTPTTTTYEYKLLALIPPKELDSILTTQGADGWRVIRLETVIVPGAVYYSALLERAHAVE